MEYPEGILYNNEAQLDAMMFRCFTRLLNDGVLKGCSANFFQKKPHPSNGKFAAVFKRTKGYWEVIENELTQAEKNNMFILDSTWYINTDI